MKYLTRIFNRGPFFFIIVLVTTVLGLIANIITNIVVDLPEPLPTSAPIVYHIEDFPREWEVLWQTTSIPLEAPSDPGAISLIADSEIAFALKRDAVIRIDLVTGDVSPCSRLGEDVAFGGPRTETLLRNSTHIYLGFAGTQKISGDMKWGAGRIEAYRADSCEPVWSRRIGGARSLDVVMVTEDTVSVNGSFSDNYYLLNADTGAVLEKLPKGEVPFIWKIEEGIVYVMTPESSFVANDQESGAVLWRSPINYGIYQPPIFLENVIVARVGSVDETGKVVAISMLDGKVLWEAENIVSNVAVGGSYVFFITKDTQLVALDLVTGEISNEVDFTPNDVNFYSATNALQVAASNNIVLTYLGDSHQLFAFRFSSDQTSSSR